MSSTEKAARVLKLLKDEEWKTLTGLEKASMLVGFPDERMISRLTGLPVDRVGFAMDSLNKRGLVYKRVRRLELTQEAVEALALREYVRRDLIAALGAVIAKGKESDVYEAIDDEGTPMALKFFKLGRISFTRVRAKRFVDRSGIKSWMTVNYEAAKREYSGLKRLEGLSASFPRALASDRSTVLLEELSGVKLSERPELKDAAEVLVGILTAARKAYVDAGLVNGDLSEYNILTDGERAWLIDWPQAVDKAHPNAKELLRHDIETVLKFFLKVYGVRCDLEEALSYVTGGLAALEASG